MTTVLKRAFILSAIALLLAVTNNLVNPNRIDWVGFWPDVTDSDSTWQSPSYEPGNDASLINLGEAYGRWTTGNYIFLDAREAEEFKIGHIKGAINLPFDYFDDYWDQVEPLLPKNTLIVTYCSGNECESSLYLARVLIEDFGYENVEIYYGGWRTWYNNRLPLEGTEGYENSHE